MNLFMLSNMLQRVSKKGDYVWSEGLMLPRRQIIGILGNRRHMDVNAVYSVRAEANELGKKKIGQKNDDK